MNVCRVFAQHMRGKKELYNNNVIIIITII